MFVIFFIIFYNSHGKPRLKGVIMYIDRALIAVALMRHCQARYTWQRLLHEDRRVSNALDARLWRNGSAQG